MAKFKGKSIQGLGSGKIGNIVYTNFKGLQVARQYNPNPANPKSQLQITQRGYLSSVVSQLRNYYYSGLYGTKDASNAWSSIVGAFLQSPVITSNKQISNKLTGNSEVRIYAKRPINKNVIGKSYSEEGLNIFTRKYFSKSASNYNAGGAADTPMIQAYTDGFFGCDYPLPGHIYIVGAQKSGSQYNSTDLTNAANGVIQAANEGEFNVTAMDTSGVIYNGVRNLGIFETIEECGSDWNYIYKLAGANSAGFETGAILNLKFPRENKSRYLCYCIWIIGEWADDINPYIETISVCSDIIQTP